MTQLARFISVGILNTTLGYLVIFFCMYKLNLSPEISNACGYGVGLIASYTLNKLFTFKSVGAHSSEFFRFISAFGVAYFLNLMVLMVLVYGVGMHEAISQLLAGLFYAATSFFLNKNFVFANRNQAKNASS